VNFAAGAQDMGMDERDVIDRLGLPDEIGRRADRMRSRSWTCSACQEVVTSPEPIAVPAPCKRCGGIAFETDRAESN
jgi:hypothetical protein